MNFASFRFPLSSVHPEWETRLGWEAPLCSWSVMVRCWGSPASWSIDNFSYLICKPSHHRGDMKVLEIRGFSIEEKYLDSKLLKNSRFWQFYFCLLRIEPQVLYMLPKQSTTELYLQA